MSALIFAAWIAATVARLAAALRRLADSLAPLTVDGHGDAHELPPRPTPTAEQRARFERLNARMAKRYEAATAPAACPDLDRCAELAEAPAPVAVAELHYVRDYHTTICGGPLGGASRATGSPQMWHAEPPATRCEACAAELRRADPHRRLQGITDTSGDADELLRGSR